MRKLSPRKVTWLYQGHAANYLQRTRNRVLDCHGMVILHYHSCSVRPSVFLVAFDCPHSSSTSSHPSSTAAWPFIRLFSKLDLSKVPPQGTGRGEEPDVHVSISSLYDLPLRTRVCFFPLGAKTVFLWVLIHFLGWAQLTRIIYVKCLNFVLSAVWPCLLKTRNKTKPLFY